MRAPSAAILESLFGGLLNYSKMEALGARIQEALRFQPVVYLSAGQRDSALIMYFLSIQLEVTEDNLYDESQRRFPIGSQGKVSPSRRKVFSRSFLLQESSFGALPLVGPSA